VGTKYLAQAWVDLFTEAPRGFFQLGFYLHDRLPNPLHLSVDLLRLDAMRFCAAVKYITCYPNCAARQSWRDSGSFESQFCAR
jgi:hypothetical protein